MSTAEELVRDMPNLTHDSLEITSQEDVTYNCIAWAAGDDTSWWWPSDWAGPPLGGYYWPAGLPKDETLSNFVRAFRRQGFRECDSADLEEGYEKVVIYVDAGGTPTHAARQLDDGRWTSKLGEDNDIAHETPGCVGGFTGDGYGEPAQFLRRPRRDDRPGPGASDDLYA